MDKTLLWTTFIKILVEVIKPLPFIKPTYLPSISLLLGMVTFPLSVGGIAVHSFTMDLIMQGALVGAAAIGLHEGIASVQDHLQQRRIDQAEKAENPVVTETK